LICQVLPKKYHCINLIHIKNWEDSKVSSTFLDDLKPESQVVYKTESCSSCERSYNWNYFFWTSFCSWNRWIQSKTWVQLRSCIEKYILKCRSYKNKKSKNNPIARPLTMKPFSAHTKGWSLEIYTWQQNCTVIS